MTTSLPRAGGEGTDEARWRRSGSLERIGRAALDVLVPPGARAVVVAPHPDDEVLGTGGLLAMLCGQRGPGSVVVVCVTDGEASHGRDVEKGRLLGARRRAESREGLSTLGLVACPIEALHLPDSDVRAHELELEDSLVSVIREGDAVFATMPNDGHPDHEATAAAAARACARSNAELWFVPIWTWHWSRPDDPRVPWAQAARLDLDAGILRLKKAAIARHRSQLEPSPNGEPPVLTPAVLAHFDRPFEVYFAASPFTNQKSR